MRVFRVYRVNEIPTVTLNWPAEDQLTADPDDAGKVIDLYQRSIGFVSRGLRPK